MDYKEPLFWIHLNMDYPFNLKGILYFPKINTEYDSLEGTIKLYNNQVFIADNIKEVIPEFLMLLKGVIDCPDLPLNVSRSALQNDGFVKKISDYITKKVADKLSGMCKTDRENYEKYWDDISPFIKFGCLKDEKFEEKMKDYILFKDLDGKYLTLQDCLDNAKEKHENVIYYVTDEKEQSQYINMFRKEGLDAVYMGHSIDSPFIGQLEQKHEGLKFLRIDADVTDTFKEEVKEEDAETFKADAQKLTDTFKKALANDKLEIKVEKLKDGQLYQPAFTDILEFQKFNRENKMRPVVVEAAKVPTVLANEAQGIILNVMGVNLPLTVSRPKTPAAQIQRTIPMPEET